MDNELQELAAELERLKPVAPSALLTGRVARELAASRRARWSWLALPLAAGLVGIVYLKDRFTVATITPIAEVPEATAEFKPVSAKNVLYERNDYGLVTLADGRPARRYRNSYVDTITWKNSRTQASLRWSVPRTEERVVPVSFQ